jgi:hypothetical protein
LSPSTFSEEIEEENVPRLTVLAQQFFTLKLCEEGKFSRLLNFVIFMFRLE